jgi:hypothetical protein
MIAALITLGLGATFSGWVGLTLQGALGRVFSAGVVEHGPKYQVRG